ncbi:hypothetical protein CLPU_3c00740 [Gottschalkia purinilytica]|uniref:Uncharacterized protein n=1 Tax=Gottschalkia purinilytica TaxID=1503 RepID=A0A0L0WCX3_GOTPU|nr:hypothetical protein [Gottschalkia purinilytica]KNF09296.1 hypothetical protein CLPU_3c00740 [Gottschalkia purinilytica]
MFFYKFKIEIKYYGGTYKSFIYPVDIQEIIAIKYNQDLTECVVICKDELTETRDKVQAITEQEFNEYSEAI